MVRRQDADKGVSTGRRACADGGKELSPRMAQLPPRRAPTGCKDPVCYGRAQVTSAHPRTMRSNTHKDNGTAWDELGEQNCLGLMSNSISQPTDAGLLAQTQGCLGWCLHSTAFNKVNRILRCSESLHRNSWCVRPSSVKSGSIPG